MQGQAAPSQVLSEATLESTGYCFVRPATGIQFAMATTIIISAPCHVVTSGRKVTSSLRKSLHHRVFCFIHVPLGLVLVIVAGRLGNVVGGILFGPGCHYFMRVTAINKSATLYQVSTSLFFQFLASHSGSALLSWPLPDWGFTSFGYGLPLRWSNLRW